MEQRGETWLDLLAPSLSHHPQLEGLSMTTAATLVASSSGMEPCWLAPLGAGGVSPSCWPPALTPFSWPCWRLGDQGQPGRMQENLAAPPKTQEELQAPSSSACPHQAPWGPPCSRVLQQANPSCSSLGEGFQALPLYLQRNPSPVLVGQSFSNKN